eukprot:11001315-Lingulodinium_polyedra.AAC.1
MSSGSKTGTSTRSMQGMVLPGPSRAMRGSTETMSWPSHLGRGSQEVIAYARWPFAMAAMAFWFNLPTALRTVSF